MNRLIIFLIFSTIVSSCRKNHVIDSWSPQEPCVFQLNLPDSVSKWRIDTFSLPINDRYNKDLFFLNEKVGFLLKDYYSLFKTVDGGKTWSQITGFKDNEIAYETYFINEKIGFVSVFGRPFARLLTTTDGGITWNNRVYSMRGSIQKIHFSDTLNGLALLSTLDNNNLVVSVIQTKNQGLTWEKISLTDSLSLSYGPVLDVLDEKNIFTIAKKSNQHYLIKSVDGGLTWQRLGNLPEYITQLKFSDEQNGFLTTTNKCYSTNDGGLTWLEKVNLKGYPKLLFMSNSNDILLNLETIQCNFGDYGYYQSKFVSLENNEIIGSKEVTFLNIRQSFFVNDKLGFGIWNSKLLRFTR